MEKIISLFQRNYDGDRLVRNEVVPGAEWVLREGNNVATRKWDGTCCMIRDGKLYKRYDAKNGKTPPEGFEPAQDPDPKTGHWPGWLPVREDNPEDRWHVEAWSHTPYTLRNDGTYELCGPKINGNPENLGSHMLIPHGCDKIPDLSRGFEAIRVYLTEHDIEGIVWHHEDGRMVKIKGKDFGIKRGARSTVSA